MYETAISVIQEYMDENFFEPGRNWPKYEFFERSCSRWAADEIIRRLIDETEKLPPYISGQEPNPPIGVIHEFINELTYYSEYGEDKGKQAMFSIAKEAAIDIILLFL